MDEAIEAEIRELLASGKTIAAIKLYRERTGVNLAVAKAAVEAMYASQSLPEKGEPDDFEFAIQIVTLLRRGDRIEAVKLYRDRFRVDLRGAKEAVERIGEQNRIPASSGSGCLGVILLGIVVALGLL